MGPKRGYFWGHSLKSRNLVCTGIITSNSEITLQLHSEQKNRPSSTPCQLSLLNSPLKSGAPTASRSQSLSSQFSDPTAINDYFLDSIPSSAPDLSLIRNCTSPSLDVFRDAVASRRQVHERKDTLYYVHIRHPVYVKTPCI